MRELTTERLEYYIMKRRIFGNGMEMEKPHKVFNRRLSGLGEVEGRLGAIALG